MAVVSEVTTFVGFDDIDEEEREVVAVVAEVTRFVGVVEKLFTLIMFIFDEDDCDERIGGITEEAAWLLIFILLLFNNIVKLITVEAVFSPKIIR